MHLLSRTTRTSPTADEDAQFTPRLAAIRLLAEKIEAKRAGLDPYDARDFIIELGPNDVKWGTISVCLCGWPTHRYERADGSVRLKAVLEADVRSELGLDTLEAPLMLDEPLASRAVDQAATLLQQMTEAALARGQRQSEPVCLDAIREAKAAYDARYPHGVESQLVIRTEDEAS